jgi:type I restriction-modification system DNA methylase subunit
LFFELLNTEQNKRKDKFGKEDIFKQIPYLNGGLFSPHNDDLYEYSPATQSGRAGLVKIPDKWFESFFELLELYNFTVDENTSYDMELSIDPEMLGRIFENLLAEINPETGKSAKKNTGSYYTPRDIVDYMVDKSLHEYLMTKTAIERRKLKAIISYSNEENESINLSTLEKKNIIDALYTLTIFDPACGSGAFPIGMLQKVVYMLQEIDKTAELWFYKATENMPILLKRITKRNMT